VHATEQLTGFAAPGSSGGERTTPVPGEAAGFADPVERARRHAISILDGSMLILLAVLAQAGAVAAHVPGAGGESLLLFGVLCFALLTALRVPVLEARLRPLRATELASVPIVTAAAAAAFVVSQAPLLGPGDAAFESLRPWLLATAYLLAGRLAFAWAVSDRPVVAVAEVLDRAAKRAFDATLAGVLLLVTAPLVAVVALAVKLEDGGPVFYRCRRLGEGGRELWMLKFRKMRHDADGPPLTSADDARFTRVGRFLAASKLDEVPQLWNVLRGEMSLVGPRPEDPAFVAMHPDDFAAIVGVKPGVTGLCQLAFAKEGRILDAKDRVRDYAERLLPQKIAIDLLYARRRTFLFDAKILAWTAIAVLLRKDVAVHRGTGQLTLRRRRRLDRSPSGAV
jgi:lipopolysaccharide/colanic/teichoic acid biosynthesis glycosyltransferase